MFMRKFCAFLSSVSRGDRGEMVPRTPRAPFHIEAELPRADQARCLRAAAAARRSDEKGFFSIKVSQSAYLIGRVRSFRQPQTLIWTLIPDIRHTGQASKLGKGNTQDIHNISGYWEVLLSTSKLRAKQNSSATSPLKATILCLSLTCMSPMSCCYEPFYMCASVMMRRPKSLLR